MFGTIFGFGLLILLLVGLFGRFGGRTRAAYYEGYNDGLRAQAGESAAEGTEAVPPAAPYYDGHRPVGFWGWGILGFFAIFFKIGFFFLLVMLFMRLIFGRRWRHRGGPWGRGPWGHHKHGHHGPGPEKSPKWMQDSDDDEPVMTV